MERLSDRVMRCDVFNEFLFCSNAKWNSPVYRRSTMPFIVLLKTHTNTHIQQNGHARWFDGAWNHTFALFGSLTQTICERIICLAKRSSGSEFSVLNMLPDCSANEFQRLQHISVELMRVIAIPAASRMHISEKTSEWFFPILFLDEKQNRQQPQFQPVYEAEMHFFFVALITEKRFVKLCFHHLLIQKWNKYLHKSEALNQMERWRDIDLFKNILPVKLCNIVRSSKAEHTYQKKYTYYNIRRRHPCN